MAEQARSCGGLVQSQPQPKKNPPAISFHRTVRGANMLLIEGYLYRLSRRNGLRSYFKCNKGCKATAVLSSGRYESHGGHHNHGRVVKEVEVGAYPSACKSRDDVQGVLALGGHGKNTAASLTLEKLLRHFPCTKGTPSSVSATGNECPVEAAANQSAVTATENECPAEPAANQSAVTARGNECLVEAAANQSAVIATENECSVGNTANQSAVTATDNDYLLEAANQSTATATGSYCLVEAANQSMVTATGNDFLIEAANQSVVTATGNDYLVEAANQSVVTATENVCLVETANQSTVTATGNDYLVEAANQSAVTAARNDCLVEAANQSAMLHVNPSVSLPPPQPEAKIEAWLDSIWKSEQFAAATAVNMDPLACHGSMFSGTHFHQSRW